MKTPFFALGFAKVLVIAVAQAAEPAPSILGTDSLGLLYKTLFQTACTITGVQVSENILKVEFTGRWASSSSAKFAATYKNGFTVTRGKSASPSAWNALRQRFNDSRDKSITILVFVNDGYDILGGIPIFSFPQDRFELILPGQKFNFPVGYQF